MTTIIVLVVVIVAMVFVGCKIFCPQPLDKGMEWGEESVNDQKIVNGTEDTTYLEMLDGPGYEYEPTEHDLKMQKMIEERKKLER